MSLWWSFAFSLPQLNFQRISKYVIFLKLITILKYKIKPNDKSSIFFHPMARSLGCSAQFQIYKYYTYCALVCY